VISVKRKQPIKTKQTGLYQSGDSEARERRKPIDKPVSFHIMKTVQMNRKLSDRKCLILAGMNEDRTVSGSAARRHHHC
jgi:hypothetical protein